MEDKERGKQEEGEEARRGVDDAVHELHVLYMRCHIRHHELEKKHFLAFDPKPWTTETKDTEARRYFSLDDSWQPQSNRTAERAELLQRMAIVVDEIMNAEERPSWLHPAMFRGPLASALCSLPPNPEHRGILMPPAPNPREIYWSKFSICNHSRPLERAPFVMPLHYYPPHPVNSQETGGSSTSSTNSEISGTNSGTYRSSQSYSGSAVDSPRCPLPRVGALPNDKFRDEKQIRLEHFVGEILRARGIQFDRGDKRSEPQAFLYQLPSTDFPNYG